jgi:hypothetical protein
MKMHFKFLANLSLLFLLVGHSTLSYSAEDNAQETSNDTPVQARIELENLDTESNVAAEPTEDDPPSAPSEESFIPSTQISEDLSVSFPVNI